MLGDACATSYVSGELAEWLEEQCMAHVRSAPNHPQTQDKIERWHQTLKNRILLESARRGSQCHGETIVPIFIDRGAP